jgi:two-component system CheB/CheR fusion protein
VSPQRLSRFFNHRDGAYHIKKNIRDNIVFSIHNLINDPPFSKIDLVSCRNLLIYFKPDAAEKNPAHVSLRPEPGQGHLFLGPSETIGECADYFSAVSAKHKIFQPARDALQRTWLCHRMFCTSHPKAHDMFKVDDQRKRRHCRLPEAYSHVERIILDEYAPPGVLVDRNFEITCTFSATPTLIWKCPTGKASFNILKMAREGLAL